MVSLPLHKHHDSLLFAGDTGIKAHPLMHPSTRAHTHTHRHAHRFTSLTKRAHTHTHTHTHSDSHLQEMDEVLGHPQEQTPTHKKKPRTTEGEGGTKEAGGARGGVRGVV